MDNFGESVDVCSWGSVAVHCPRLVRVCCVSRAERVFLVYIVIVSEQCWKTGVVAAA